MKYAFTVLVTILLTVTAAYFSLSAQAVSRPEMVQYVATNSPYTHDRAAIAVQLKDIQSVLTSNQEDLRYLDTYIRSVLTQVAILRTNLEDLRASVNGGK